MLDTNKTTVCNAGESVAEEYTAYLLCSSLFGRVSLTDDGVEEKFAQRLRQEEQEHTRTSSVEGAERRERGTCVLVWFGFSSVRFSCCPNITRHSRFNLSSRLMVTTGQLNQPQFCQKIISKSDTLIS